MRQFRKRMLTTTLALAIVAANLTATTVSAADKIDFNDIQGHWAESIINEFTNLGYLNGYDDNTFKPNNSITRAEFIKVINKVFGFTAQAEEDFTDVNSEDWYYEEVLKALGAGYIDGYEDNTFKPNDKITRQEACKIVATVIQATGHGRTNFSDDEQIQDWAISYVKGLVDLGVIDGYDDNTFKPDNNMTRAESVKTIDVAENVQNTIVPEEQTIQQAIDAAKPGATIVLEKGEYTENLKINKSINIIGKDKANTILNGKITVSTDAIDSIKISNMTINADNQHLFLTENTNVKSVAVDNVIFNHLVSANQATMYFWGTQEAGGYDLISITNSTFNYPNAGTGSDIANIDGEVVDKSFVGQTYDANKVVFSNNTINQNAKATIRKGFELSGKVSEFIAENNKFDKTRYPIFAWLTDTSAESNFGINNNEFNNSTTAPVEIDIWTGSVLGTLNATGNKFNNCAGEIKVNSGITINSGNMAGEYTNK